MLPSHPGMVGAHQAEADGAVPIGWGEDVPLSPGHPLVQAAYKARGSERGEPGGRRGWRGNRGSPAQVGQQPPAGAGSGWEQLTEQLTASHSTRPPCEGHGRLSPTSGWRSGDGMGWG